MTESSAAIAGPRAGKRFVAPPDSLLAAVLLSFLATAGFFYVNIMPAIVSGLIDSLHFSARDAGQVGSANVYGAALGALLAVWLAQRLPWRVLAVIALAGLISMDLLSVLLADPATLTAARLVHGMIGGVLVGTAFLVISRTRVPERTFGVLVFVQFSLGGVGLVLLPQLVIVVGARLLFLVLVAFSLVTLAMLPFLDSYPPAGDRVNQRRSSPAGSGSRAMLIMALFAVFLFQAGNMALSAYVIELARAYGLTMTGITATLGAANWIGLLGCILVVLVGVRFGRVRPLIPGFLVTLAGTAAYHLSGQIAWFVAACIITTITWSFCGPYLFGICAAFDHSGRSATLASFCSKMGLATGPFVASRLVGRQDWGLIIDLATVALAGSAILGLLAARTLDRARHG